MADNWRVEALLFSQSGVAAAVAAALLAGESPADELAFARGFDCTREALHEQLLKGEHKLSNTKVTRACFGAVYVVELLRVYGIADVDLPATSVCVGVCGVCGVALAGSTLPMNAHYPL